MLDYFTINNGALDLHANAAGVRMLTRITGLFGMPGPRDDARPRMESDGAVEWLNQFMEPRIITLEGAVFSDAVNSAYVNWRATQKQLLSLFRTAQLAKFRTTGSGLDLQANVRVASAVQAEAVKKGPQKHYEYQMLLRAADPLLYAQTPVIVGPTITSVSVTNPGDANTWPLITIHGPITNPVITNTTTGKTIVFSGLTVGSTQTLTIDTAPPRSATLSTGAIVTGNISAVSSDFPYSSASGVAETWTITGTGTTGATTITVNIRPAYLN